MDLSNIDVAKSLAKLYATQEGREFLRGGRTQKSSVVVCDSGDLVVDVMRRTQSWDTDGAMIVFILEESLRFIDIRPAFGGADGSLSSQRVADGVEIGMLYNAAAATGEKRFHLGSSWQRDGVASVPESADIFA